MGKIEIYLVLKPRVMYSHFKAYFEMGKIVDLTKLSGADTMRKSDIAALEGDVGYYSRMLEDDWFEEYDKYFDADDVNDHLESLYKAIDDVEHGSGKTTKQALARTRDLIDRVNVALALHRILSTDAGAGESTSLTKALVRVAKTWSPVSETPIPIFAVANALVATPVPWTA